MLLPPASETLKVTLKSLAESWDRSNASPTIRSKSEVTCRGSEPSPSTSVLPWIISTTTTSPSGSLAFNLVNVAPDWNESSVKKTEKLEAIGEYWLKLGIELDTSTSSTKSTSCARPTRLRWPDATPSNSTITSSSTAICRLEISPANLAGSNCKSVLSEMARFEADEMDANWSSSVLLMTNSGLILWKDFSKIFFRFVSLIREEESDSPEEAISAISWAIETEDSPLAVDRPAISAKTSACFIIFATSAEDCKIFLESTSPNPAAWKGS